MYFCILLSVCMITSSVGLKFSSLDTAYKKGVEAYSGERWSECIAQFETAQHLYKLYKSIIINCRLRCTGLQYEESVEDNMDNFRAYEKIFREKNCLDDCQRKEFDKIQLFSDVDESIIDNMQAKKPYDYLHICYFQMNALPKAASAAYTYFMAHPDSDQMKNNLHYYAEQPEVDRNEIVDLESEDYQQFHKLGVNAYHAENWGETITAMEEVISAYLAWENTCRMECEFLPEQQWDPDFIVTTSNHIAALLQCKQQCQERLKPFKYNSGLEFLADTLNYLQISYYHLNRIEDAAKALTTYLAIMPSDEDMLSNRDIYTNLVGKEAFVARAEVIHYMKRDIYEKRLLDIFHQGLHSVETNAT